ncbi:hypothetical protein KE336_gp36 [Aeromonas phage 4_D05]|uniref:Uncharacterized protein n=1 Tax=Aeromonas phage 4_D05 TaxID=2588099 RepID=A0A514TUB2_9CAUD|nr:hypothetical protein KE336_gp36 [Aeromonas phage 4_D05]QDJ96149.1 hypothetical protein 4D05_036 [Aeromonas phage 4_D05]
MIDLEIAYRCAATEVATGYGCEQSSLTNDDVVELVGLLRQAEKDAERHRWLIGNGTLDSDRDGNCELHFRVASPINTMDLGIIIDEAMKCK